MEERACYRCHQTKTLPEFAKNKNKPLGYGYLCRECMRLELAEWRKKNPKKHQQQVLRWRRKNKDKVANYSRKTRERPEYRIKEQDRQRARLYGLAPGTYDAMLMAQDYKCLICKRTRGTSNGGVFSVDHDHKTGKVRGLLCARCNSGLGYFEHDQQLLQLAINYLIS